VTVITDTDAGQIAALESRAWKKLKANKGALVGGGFVLFFIALALLAPLLPIADPNATDWSAIRKAPSAVHWLGTDEIGRDVLSRMIWGAQASLLAGVVSVLIAVAIGVPFGLVSGYFGGWTDQVISRMTDALLAMPFLILAIALAAFLGPQPHQRDDRHRPFGDADLHPTDARPGAGRQNRRLCRGRPRHRPRSLPHNNTLHPAQRVSADPGASDADRGDGDHR
jgi:ABC-type dipeptide/oligopeptide/nickel transport system permease subunit